MLTKLWKTTFNNGIIIPVKIRRCEERKVEILFLTCNNQVNEKKHFEANLNLTKR